jgi:REP element-mobilizing transposase RayT
VGRKPRDQRSGVLYHVTARGNVRQDIYLGDEDRETFLGFVSLACEREELICHAYCLMGNHYHLLVQTPGANIGSAMHRINCLHANRFNRVYGREGHVFERPYRASIMHGGRRELEAARYIDRNPVCAGLCAAPEQWRWSSHVALIGRAPCPAFLSTDRLTTWFGTDESEARERYRMFVDAGVDAPYERPPLESLLRRGDHAALEAARAAGYSLRAIAAVVGLSAATLSRRLAHAATEP